MNFMLKLSRFTIKNHLLWIIFTIDMLFLLLFCGSRKTGFSFLTATVPQDIRIRRFHEEMTKESISLLFRWRRGEFNSVLFAYFSVLHFFFSFHFLCIFFHVIFLSSMGVMHIFIFIVICRYICGYCCVQQFCHKV